jgi:TPR repeat protein
MIGVMYLFGQGTPQDYALAKQCLEKSAAQGNADAQFNLRVMHDKGLGIGKNYSLVK